MEKQEKVQLLVCFGTSCYTIQSIRSTCPLEWYSPEISVVPIFMMFWTSLKTKCFKGNYSPSHGVDCGALCFMFSVQYDGNCLDIWDFHFIVFFLLFPIDSVSHLELLWNWLASTSNKQTNKLATSLPHIIYYLSK